MCQSGLEERQQCLRTSVIIKSREQYCGTKQKNLERKKKKRVNTESKMLCLKVEKKKVKFEAKYILILFVLN